MFTNPHLARGRNTDTRAARTEHVRLAALRNAELRGVIDEIRAAAAEPLTLAAIAARLNAAGYRAARNQSFHTSTVVRIVRSGRARTDAGGP